MTRRCASALATAIVLAAQSAVASESYTVTREVEIPGDAAEIWHATGDFCDIDDWNPRITDCALKARDGAVHRRITVGEDAVVWEKLIAVEPGLSYTYRIVESPFPLKRYVATFSITRGTPNRVTWSGRFKSDDPGMEKALGDLYDSGLSEIARRLSD